MKKYFVNPGNEPIYIKAMWVQIKTGMLQFFDEDDKLIREFEIHERLYFDDLNNI
jgi:hypothetical protein